jgi:cellulose biosynthesis protein BcsQ
MVTRTGATKVINQWKQIPTNYGEGDLEKHLVMLIWQTLNLKASHIKSGVNLGHGSGLKADFLIYQDPTQPPVLVVENKKRHPNFANALDQGFADWCKDQPLYRQAVGYPVPSASNNGIRQYLDKDRVDPIFLASYGWVFNGDFFQLWRRVDGLVFPMTPIQKFTEATIPRLLQQLEYCLSNPQRALVTTIWNQKGGVAKTTNTINLGATLAAQGKKVLLIDLDTQADLTTGLGIDPTHHSDYLHPCLNELQLKNSDAAKKILQDAIQQRSFPTTSKTPLTLDVLPGERKALDDFRDSNPTKPNSLDSRTKVLLFKKLLELLRESYDYIFIDVSPSIDTLSDAVLLSCDTVLIPLDYGRKALHHGVNVYQKLIPKVRGIRAKKEHLHLAPWSLGAVFSNCPPDCGTQLEDSIKKELESKNFTGSLCKTRLKTYGQTKLAEFKRVPVICWQNSPISKLYKELADEIFLNHHFIDD